MHLEDTFEEKNVDKSIFFLQSFKIYFPSSLFNKVVLVIEFPVTGNPPLTRFFGAQKNWVKGKPS